jgi:CheY-like chemotaxis protein
MSKPAILTVDDRWSLRIASDRRMPEMTGGEMLERARMDFVHRCLATI